MKLRLSIICLSLLAAGVARAQQALSPLRANLAVGQSWKYSSDQTTDSKNEISANGQSQSINTVTKMHRAGTIKVLAVANGVPTSIRVAFDKECNTTQEANGQQQSAPYAYAGATVTITRGGNGQVTDDFNGQADAETQADAHGLLDLDAVVMPNKPVSVNSEWSGDPAIVGRVLQLAAGDQGGMTLKWLSTKTVDGRPTAEVKLSFAIMKNAGGLNGKIINQGTVLVDLATGHTIKTDLHGTVELTGRQQGQGGQVFDIKGSGTVTIAAAAPLDGQDAAPVPAAPMAGGGVGGGGNPLDDNNKLAPFVGTFSNDKLKVDLARTGETLSGTIALNGKSFPATAALKDSAIAGSFTVDGRAYPFTAILSPDGSTLRLTSGTTTYELKKAAGNPLDSGPANPLSPRSDAGGARGTVVGSPANAAGYQALVPPMPYVDLATVPHGQAWAAFAGDKSATTALKSCIQQVASAFAGTMKTANAAIDDKDREGFAPFTATANGQPVQGKIVCTPLSNGSFVSIFFARTDAGKQEWSTLAEAVPTIPPMHPLILPGNTGTICAPDGWNIVGGDNTLGSVVLKGPNGEGVSRSVYVNFEMPQRYTKMGMRPPQAGNISDFLLPSKALMKLIDVTNQQPNASRRTVQHMDVATIPAVATNDPNAVCERIQAQIVVNENGHDTLMDDLTFAQSIHLSNDAWTLAISGVSAPHDRYIRSQPMLQEIYNSYQIDDEAVRKNTEMKINNIVATAKQLHDQQEHLFEVSQHANADREAARHKSAMDTVEMLSGHRDVLDTKTGTMGSADYYNVDGIVGALNGSAGYGRFKQIPLSSQQ